jgi:hypothetical protein
VVVVAYGTEMQVVPVVLAVVVDQWGLEDPEVEGSGVLVD